jgi:hypothetical protein
MQPEIWIGVVEISFLTEDTPPVRKNAFTKVTTWARSSEKFEQQCKKMLESYGWSLLGIDNSSPAAARSHFSDEAEDMLERTAQNPKAIIYGTFYTYPVM